MDLIKDVLVGGFAAVGAGFFTNPLETIKTRMQLQGELAARGKHVVHFRNMFHAAVIIARTDGILALQNGLVPALWTQFFLNGFRFGMYQFVDNYGWLRDEQRNIIIYKSMFWGTVSGGVGAFVCSPFFLIKTQLQSKATKSIAVGTQHDHKGSFRALQKLYKTHGIKGLWRGIGISVPRAMIGSTAQLTSFSYCKEWLREHDVFLNSPILQTFFASMVGGVAISIAITPFDLLSIRIYNQDVLVGGLAGVGAGFFTTPIETIKIRMQLQGELAARGKHVVHFKNMFHAAVVIARTDGILALQQGLVPALWTQFFLNAFRLGMYQVADNKGWLRDEQHNIIFYKSTFVGMLSGAGGALACSPFFLIKTQLQSRAPKSIAVGTQHDHHEGSFRALQKIYRTHGIKGLWRGIEVSVPRSMIGTTAQLTSFYYCKDWLREHDLFLNSPILQTFFASMVGGVAISIAITPLDLMATRIYNQAVDANGKGLLYTGIFDCIRKIWETEGFLGFYKGLLPNYVRLGPYTVLSLIFWEELKDLRTALEK